MTKQEALSKFIPHLTSLREAKTAKEHSVAIESILKEFNGWQYPSDREIEITACLQELLHTLTDFSVQHIQGKPSISLSVETGVISDYLNGLYGLCYP